MFIIKKHSNHNKKIMIPCLKKFNWFRGLMNAKTKGNCQKLKKKKIGHPVGPPSATLIFEETVSMGAKGIWWSQVMHLMHLNIVSLACRFCILVANLVFLESQILLSSAREDLLVRNSTNQEVNNLCHSFSSEFQNILAEIRSTFNIHQCVFSTVSNSSLLDAWFL